MNKIILKPIVFTVIASIFTMSCNDSKLPPIDNMVYISEASAATEKQVTLKKGDINHSNLTVRLVRPLNKAVKVSVKADEAVLNAYNKKNETEYKMLDSKYFSFPESVVIEAGKVSSAPIDIQIKTFAADGNQYAIPFKVESLDGSIGTAKKSSSIMLNIVKPLTQMVPLLQHFNASRATPYENWGLALPNYTLEWWVKMSDFSINNQAIINSGGEETELYIRFGDKIYADATGEKFNFLQIKTLGAQFDTGDPTKGKGLTPNVWMHFAITYDAGSGTSIMYMNGNRINTLNTAKGKSMIIDRLQIVSSGSQYFRDKCEMCQIRLWNTTRSEMQIQKSMYYPVNPKHPNLLLYIPMDEGPGASEFKDISGNNHNIRIVEEVSWSEYTFSK